MDSKEKEQGIITESPSKIYGSYFIMEKNKNIFWFVNNFEYHHREMGLMTMTFQNLLTRSVLQ